MNRMLAAALLLIASTTLAAETDDSKVGPVPDEVRKEFKLAPFYEKLLDVGGMPIVASSKVSDYSLLEARYLVRQMTGHKPEILAALAKQKIRLAIMAPDEFTTDLPEHSHLRPKAYWDRRARGLGASLRHPAVSCGEESLLGYRGDPYASENIMIHEFAHAMHECGLNLVDKTFDERLRKAFEAGKERGLWKGKYAGTNRNEYWAEGVQSWFDDNREPDHDHNHVNTRAELKEYDPPLAALCEEIFGDGEWRYLRPQKRTPAPAHLAGYDPKSAQRFSWEKLAERQKEQTEEEIVAPLAAEARAEWKSPGSSQRVTLRFANNRKSEIELVWIDFEGQPAQRVTMRGGSLQERQTFAGHIFRATDADGKLIGYYVAGEKDGSVIFK
jgi:hypothetical protein